MANNEKFLWVCELNKDCPAKIWRSMDVMELESEDDTDFVIHSLIFKTAVLGATAIEGERNLVSVKTKGYQENFEQPIFSLTLGRNDMVSGMDLTLACDHNQDVEFKLTHGTGPVYITCTHMLELPTADEHPTMMTTSDGDCEEVEESDECEEGDEKKENGEELEDKGKRVTAASLKNGMKKNGIDAVNGSTEEMVDDK
jgi:hypothetical protein